MKLSILVLLIPTLSFAYMGMGAEMEVYVTGCQTHPLIGAHIVILGEQLATEIDKDGFYEFEFSVDPGEHTIYAYTEYSEFYRDDFVIVEGMEKISWHIMLCTCVENVSALTGEVTDGKGSPVAGATVSIDELFLSTTSNKKGVYYLVAPPGDWEVTVRESNYGSASKKFKFAGIEDPSIEPVAEKYDFKLSK